VTVLHDDTIQYNHKLRMIVENIIQQEFQMYTVAVTLVSTKDDDFATQMYNNDPKRWKQLVNDQKSCRHFILIQEHTTTKNASSDNTTIIVHPKTLEYTKHHNHNLENIMKSVTPSFPRLLHRSD
jgi:U3 small nucleolar RNA-associated protein 14